MAGTCLSIGKDYEFQKRAQEVCGDLKIPNMRVDDAELLAEDERIGKEAKFALLSASKIRNEKQLQSIVQTTKFGAPNARLFVIAEKRLSPETAIFLKKSGAEAVLLEDEFLMSTKIDFIFSQSLHTEMVPIKSAEIKPNTTPDFTLYHLLPLNERMIAFHQAGQSVEATKHKKILEVGEIYIRGDDLDSFAKYVEKHRASSAAGLQSQCRAKYVNLTYTYKKLVLMLTDQSEAASYDRGKELLAKLYEIAKELVENLASVGESWEVVNNAPLGDMTAVDRAPAIAAASGLLSLVTGIGKPEDVLVAGLIADIGLLDLTPAALRLLKAHKMGDFNQEQKLLYETHPLVSINRCLARKLPIPDNLKAIVLNSHERVDSKGFPNRPVASKIPIESMLIHFCELVDSLTQIEMGKSRKDPREVRNKVINDELQQGSRFSIELLTQLRKHLQES